MSNLFREEVLNHSPDRHGLPIGISSRQIKLYVIGLVIAFLAVLALIAFGSYSRKATVAGYLLPSEGIVKIISPREGRIVEMAVREGQVVVEDEVLFVVDVGTEVRSGRTSNLMHQRITEQRDLLLEEFERLKVMNSSETLILNNLVARKNEEFRILLRRIDALSRKVEILRKHFQRLSALAKKNVYSVTHLEEAELKFTEAQAEYFYERRGATVLKAELDEAEIRLGDLPKRQANEVSRLQRQILEMEEHLSRVEGTDRILVRAPGKGTITRLAVSRGATVDEDVVIATFMPAGSELQAFLLVPNRSAGFVSPGMRVRIRYDAFPYQKFGVHQARIETVSQTTVVSDQLPYALDHNEPVYVATAALDSESISVGDEKIALQSGTKFKADLVFENRRFYEWIFGPLLSVTASSSLNG